MTKDKIGLVYCHGKAHKEIDFYHLSGLFLNENDKIKWLYLDNNVKHNPDFVVDLYEPYWWLSIKQKDEKEERKEDERKEDEKKEREKEIKEKIIKEKSIHYIITQYCSAPQYNQNNNDYEMNLITFIQSCFLLLNKGGIFYYNNGLGFLSRLAFYKKKIKSEKEFLKQYWQQKKESQELMKVLLFDLVNQSEIPITFKSIEMATLESEMWIRFEK